MKRKLFGISAISVLILCSLFFIPTFANAQQIEESEAVQIATLWYVMEYNAGHNSYAKDTGLKLEDVKIAGVKVLLADDVLVESNGDQSLDAYAYIVEFDPVGWVAISSHEVLTPVIAFAVENKFSWRDPSEDGFSYTLSEIANAGAEASREAYFRGEQIVSHKNWTRFRKVISDGYDPRTVSRAVVLGRSDSSGNGNTVSRDPSDERVEWKTARWDQNCSEGICAWNTDVARHNGGLDVPAGCNTQVYAVKMRFHEWPLRGEGETEYWNDVGNLSYHHHVFHDIFRNWDDYSLSYITYEEWENDTVPWEHISWLMYEVAVALRSDFSLSAGTSANTKVDPMSRTKIRRV